MVGCDTGYTRSASRALNHVLERDYGLVLDVTTNSEEVVAGRPAPWMIYDLMQKANIYSPEAVVKVDDTTLSFPVPAGRGSTVLSVTH